MLKHYIQKKKRAVKDVFEMHGFCTPAVAASCSELAPSVPGELGDGYRGLGQKLVYNMEAAVSRSPGACSTLCNSVAECQYWIVHNRRGTVGVVILCGLFPAPLTDVGVWSMMVGMVWYGGILWMAAGGRTHTPTHLYITAIIFTIDTCTFEHDM